MQKRSAKKGTNGVGEPKKARTTSKGNTKHQEEEEEEIFNVFSLEIYAFTHLSRKFTRQAAKVLKHIFLCLKLCSLLYFLCLKLC